MTQIECSRISSTVCAGQQTAAVFQNIISVCLYETRKLATTSPPLYLDRVQSSAFPHTLFPCNSFRYYFLLSAFSFLVGIWTEFCL